MTKEIKKYTTEKAIGIYKESLRVSPNNTIDFKIKISFGFDGKPFIKQLKSFNSVWDNCQFFINENINECDFWIVYGDTKEKESVICCPSNTLLITVEPPSVKKYQKKFTDQFASILTCQKNIKHPNKIQMQQALPWWVGHKLNDKEGTGEYSKTYNELKSVTNIEKNKIISVIVSNKKFTKGHKERLVFIEKLKNSFGDSIDIFGSGFNEINDKWDAISNYKYHIVLENSSLDDYWTEKLSDAFLGLSYPIYYGCSNIYKYFSADSLSIIDITRPDEAMDKIRSIIKSGTYEKSKESILRSRDLVLDEYQLFPLLVKYANNHKKEKRGKLITINPEHISPIMHRIRNLLKLFKKLLQWKTYTYLLK